MKMPDQETPKEINEYTDLIFAKMKEINDGLNYAPDDDSGEGLKALLSIITLGKYLKERFDSELMDNLELVNSNRRNYKGPSYHEIIR